MNRRRRRSRIKLNRVIKSRKREEENKQNVKENVIYEKDGTLTISRLNMIRKRRRPMSRVE